MTYFRVKVSKRLNPLWFSDGGGYDGEWLQENFDEILKIAKRTTHDICLFSPVQNMTAPFQSLVCPKYRKELRWYIYSPPPAILPLAISP